MSKLNDFPSVHNNLKTSRKNSICALHKFIFEHEGDRNNRQRLRGFSGFNYNDDTVEYTRKIEYVNANLNVSDLTSICNILCLDYNRDDLERHIFKNLQENQLLQHMVEADNDDESDNDNNNDESCEVGVNTNKTTNLTDIETMSVTSHYSDARPISESRRQETQHNVVGGTEVQQLSRSRFSLNFKDVEDSIRAYDGTGNISIQFWINEFEEMAELMQWDELQKIIFAKRSLKGLAKTFILSEHGLTTWAKLSNALTDEFSEKTNSAKLHELLIERKMLKGESVLGYLYTMKEIASKGNIEESALIQYVIDGIRDLNVNKTILYGATNIKDFKKKLNDYEIFTAKQNSVNTTRTVEKKTYANNSKPNNSKVNCKCYNCGAKGHISSECKNKAKGVKCFSCNTYGHLAKNCPNQAQPVNNGNMRRITVIKERMMIRATINKITLNALFDTGSKYNILKESLCKKANLVRTPTIMQLYGFGSQKSENGISTKGRVTCEVMLDEQEFEISFLIVSDKFMDIDCILGEEFCKNKIVTIDDGGIHFKTVPVIKDTNDLNNSQEEVDSIKCPDIMKINCENETEINIDPIASVEAKSKVIELINNYMPMKTKFTNIEMKIIVKDETPIYSRPYRLPITERRIVDEQVEKWLDEDIIEPSDSEFTSPAILVKKKDGSPRMCIDYRKINKVVVRDRYPLPLIEDQLDNLKGAVVFSTVDLQNGFFHVPVCEESRKYTSFPSWTKKHSCSMQECGRLQFLYKI